VNSGFQKEKDLLFLKISSQSNSKSSYSEAIQEKNKQIEFYKNELMELEKEKNIKITEYQRIINLIETDFSQPFQILNNKINEISKRNSINSEDSKDIFNKTDTSIFDNDAQCLLTERDKNIEILHFIEKDIFEIEKIKNCNDLNKLMDIYRQNKITLNNVHNDNIFDITISDQFQTNVKTNIKERDTDKTNRTETIVCEMIDSQINQTHNELIHEDDFISIKDLTYLTDL